MNENVTDARKSSCTYLVWKEMKVEDLPLIELRLVRDESFDLCIFASMIANLVSISIEIVEVLYSNQIKCEKKC